MMILMFFIEKFRYFLYLQLCAYGYFYIENEFLEDINLISITPELSKGFESVVLGNNSDETLLMTSLDIRKV